MKFLKMIPVFKHGYGDAIYIDITDLDDIYIDEVKQNYHEDYGDPEGLRSSKFEIIDMPPLKWVENNLKSALDSIDYLNSRIATLRKQLEIVENAEKDS